MKKDPLMLLQEAHNEFGKARGKLSNALRAWLETYNFPAEIEQGFDISLHLEEKTLLHTMAVVSLKRISLKTSSGSLMKRLSIYLIVNYESIRM